MYYNDTLWLSGHTFIAGPKGHEAGPIEGEAWGSSDPVPEVPAINEWSYKHEVLLHAPSMIAINFNKPDLFHKRQNAWTLFC